MKTKRLRNLLTWLHERYDGSLEQMFPAVADTLREELLSVSGIGPETADSILLYAGGLPMFVVDAYTHRVLVRHGWIDAEADYYRIQELFVESLPADAALFNEYHALLVRVGKEHCKPTPVCEGCPLVRVASRREDRWGTSALMGDHRRPRFCAIARPVIRALGARFMAPVRTASHVWSAERAGFAFDQRSVAILQLLAVATLARLAASATFSARWTKRWHFTQRRSRSSAFIERFAISSCSLLNSLYCGWASIAATISWLLRG